MTIFIALFFVSVYAAAVFLPAKGEVPCANGTVQLVGGPNEFEGRVEFCANGSWAQVCDSGAWGPIPASLVCSAINSNRLLNNVTSDYYGMNNLRMNSVNIHQAVCRPKGKFSDCVDTNIHNQGCNGLLASVACPANCEGGSVRLTPDSQRTGGLVEFCLYNEAFRLSYWTGVCSENFTLAAARIVCRQLGLLQSDLSVTISNSSTRHWRTYYDSGSCIGNELSISDCPLVGYREEARCSPVMVNCQGGSLVDSTTSPEGATGSEFSSSSIASVATGNTPTESEMTSSQETAESILVSNSGSDILIIITGTICGFVILLLLTAVIMLTLILVTKSRNKRKLKDAVPTMVNGSQQQSNTTDNRSPHYIQRLTSCELAPSQTTSLKPKLTANNTSTWLYAKPSDIQTMPLPIPTDSHGYPSNNLQRDSGIILPQLDTFLPPEADPDVHIYAEPSEQPGLIPNGHEYAELESCGGRNQNSMGITLAAPLPYEIPMVVGAGNYINVTVPEPSTQGHSTRSDDKFHGVECQTVTSLSHDHQYAIPGLPS